MKRFVKIGLVVFLCGIMTSPILEAQSRQSKGSESHRSATSARSSGTSRNNNSSSSNKSTTRSSSNATNRSNNGSSTKTSTNRSNNSSNKGATHSSGNTTNRSTSGSSTKASTNRSNNSSNKGATHSSGNTTNRSTNGSSTKTSPNNKNNSGNKGTSRPSSNTTNQSSNKPTSNKNNKDNAGNNGNTRPGGNVTNQPANGNNGNSAAPRPANGTPNKNNDKKPSGNPGVKWESKSNRPMYKYSNLHPHRIPLKPYSRPKPPRSFRPHRGCPVISNILGLTIGMAFDLSMDYLFNKGYTIDRYGDNIVCLRDVNEYGFLWHDAILYYDDAGGLVGSQFSYSTSYYDLSRYNSLYNKLFSRYGNPVDTQNTGTSLSSTWFGYDNQYVSIGFSPMYAEDGQLRYYTTLSFGV